MALKDWKKDIDSRYEFVFDNKYTYRRIVCRKNLRSSYYNVLIEGTSNKNLFYTKTAAKRFALNYMKKVKY